MTTAHINDGYTLDHVHSHGTSDALRLALADGDAACTLGPFANLSSKGFRV